MDKKLLVYLMVLFTAAFGLAGCGGQKPAGSADSGGDGPTTVAGGQGGTERTEAAGQTSQEEPGDTTASSGAGKETTSSSGTGSGNANSVTIRVGGEPGLEFSGRCVVDGKRRDLGDQVPQTYTYEPRERLRCEVSSRERGKLRVSFSDGEGTNTLQEVGPQRGTVELNYTGNDISTSTRSRSQTSSQSSSQSSSSNISSSQSITQSSSSATRPGSE